MDIASKFLADKYVKIQSSTIQYSIINSYFLKNSGYIKMALVV